MDSCIISLNLNCILQLKQFNNIATKVSCRKKCYYFWWSTWLIRSYSFVCTLHQPTHYHHCANLSLHIELMICLPDKFCRVCKIEHVLIVIHYSIYGAVCFQFTQFPRDGWENILLCLIIIIKSEVWTIIHCLGLGHETMVCAVCLFIFFFLYILDHTYLKSLIVWKILENVTSDHTNIVPVLPFILSNLFSIPP